MTTTEKEQIKSELPSWFSLIQTDRNYYEKRYHEIENGQNKLNMRCFLSAIIGNYWFLFYRKYAFLVFIILGIFGYFVNSFIIPFMQPILILNKVEIQNVFIISILTSFLLNACIFYMVFKKYDAWYLEFIEKRYNQGYTTDEFKDTSPLLKYIAWIGTIVSFIAPFYLMKAYPAPFQN